MKRRKLLITVSVLALAAAGTGIYVAPLMADPAGDKDCGSGPCQTSLAFRLPRRSPPTAFVPTRPR